jgi:hypothetical protein
MMKGRRIMDEAPFNEYELRRWLYQRLTKGVPVETCRGEKRFGVIVDVKALWGEDIWGVEVHVRFLDSPARIVACDPTVLRPMKSAVEMLATLKS